MHSNEEPTRAGGALSTEDLAQPPGAPAPGGAQPQDTGPAAPVYPGESTGEGAPPQPTPDSPAGPADTTTSVPGDTRAQGATEGGTAEGSGEEAAPELLTAEEERSFRDRWHEVQSRFVDDPREAVHTADGLVADVMQTLAATFARHKQDLEGQWSQGERVDTEDLRRALRRYRSFFNRLLST
ncbi:hypothetical protein [Streptomyces naganishii]|uniref:Uncharacterized protein n=1 Tax=Streptomyces naganishii JCM 4654 TaxID=1306179 RepID=A0A919CUN4_9ACTN|nr:hypothetical protein [Streptomyces naganishii]GHD87487.1 hypothetical protein GCM10010508_19810 [Streptomyces naganishii JCM 4654]